MSYRLRAYDLGVGAFVRGAIREMALEAGTLADAVRRALGTARLADAGAKLGRNGRCIFTDGECWVITEC